MVRLIHHEHIPAGVQGLLDPPLIAGKQFHAGEHNLAFEEWINFRIGCFDGFAPFLIKDMKPEIETAEQFHEPLMNQGLRHDDQHAGRPSGENQPVKNQARFNGFSKSDFIRQQDTRHQPPGHFRCDVELVWNKIDPSSHEAANFGFAPAMLMLERGNSQVEDSGSIELSGEKPLLRFVKADPVAEFSFADLVPAGTIVKKSAALADRLYSQWCVLVRLDRVTRSETHASKRAARTRVLTLLPARVEHSRDRPGPDAHNRAQSEFG